MKQLEINLKEITKAGMGTFLVLGDASVYWFRQISRTVHSLVVDTFSMKLNGNIQDFTWEKDELFIPVEREHVASVPLIKPETSGENTGGVPSERKTGRIYKMSRLIIIRPLKRFLRFFFIDLPGWIKPPAREAEDPDPYANRIRSGG